MHHHDLLHLIRSVCAREFKIDYEYPFFSYDYREGETADDALLRLFRDERPLQTSDEDTVLVMCHG